MKKRKKKKSWVKIKNLSYFYIPSIRRKCLAQKELTKYLLLILCNMLSPSLFLSSFSLFNEREKRRDSPTLNIVSPHHNSSGQPRPWVHTACVEWPRMQTQASMWLHYHTGTPTYTLCQGLIITLNYLTVNKIFLSY